MTGWDSRCCLCLFTSLCHSSQCDDMNTNPYHTPSYISSESISSNKSHSTIMVWPITMSLILHYLIPFKKFCSLIFFLLATLILAPRSSLACCASFPLPGKSTLCSCRGTVTVCTVLCGFCVRALAALAASRLCFLLFANASPTWSPSSSDTLTFGSSIVHSQGGYSLSSRARGASAPLM